MAELKREYVVPLRRKSRFAPKWRRSKKAVSVLKEFIEKHMKTDKVIICPELNEKIWENGIKNPPGKVSVIAFKSQLGGVERTLVNLVDVGVDQYVKQYQVEEVKVEEPEQKEEKKEESETKAEEKEEVKEAEVKEVKEEKKEEEKKNE